MTNYIKKIIETISANPPAPTNTPAARTAGFWFCQSCLKSAIKKITIYIYSINFLLSSFYRNASFSVLRKLSFIYNLLSPLTLRRIQMPVTLMKASDFKFTTNNPRLERLKKSNLFVFPISQKYSLISLRNILIFWI